MSRATKAQELVTDQLHSTIAGLRVQVAGLKGELQGERRGEHRVAGQLADDIRQSALREEQHRIAAQRAVGDVQRLLRLVAGHVLDVRQGAPLPDQIELFVDALHLQGFSLNGALIAEQIARADASAKVSAAEAVQAVVSAPGAGPRTI